MNLLLLSSCVFITNVFFTFYKKQYLYSLLFVGLLFTSFLFHSNPTLYHNLLDKGMILSIVLYGSYGLYCKRNVKKIHQIYLIFITFFAVLFFFYYGYCSRQYCYHPDQWVSDSCHCGIHLLSSLGHHFILFL